jgi:hypothetical protein
MDESQIIDALKSRSLERQVTALDEVARVINSLLSESVRVLAESETPFPIAARLFKFGPPVIPVLEDLLKEQLSENARDHTAALLLELGSRSGVPHLLSLLEQQAQASTMAALALGKARIQEATPRIRLLLEEWNCESDPYTAGTYIRALKSLNALPDSLKESLRERWPAAMKPGLEKLLEQ